MKRIFTLFLLAISAFSFKTSAQPGSTNCNAEFAVQYLGNATVKFNPALTEGAPLVQHTWTFGDGTSPNTQVSPTHSYALPGTYPVVHTISRVTANGTQVCAVSFTKLVTIAADCNLAVNFNWTSVAANPLTIAFQNLSSPLSNTDSITWLFGDNTISHDVNPVHTYANGGTYNVCLIVKKVTNSTVAPCVREICKTVVIQTPCNLVADFTWNATNNNPLTIEFHNQSAPLSPSDSIRWTFGDGSSSNAVNPVHTYNLPGTYTVCLRVQKNNSGTAPCVREICKTIVVSAPPCNLVVDFSWHATTANPLALEFINLSIPLSNTDSITWHFGDGSFSNLVNAVHTYSQPGTYTVCLRVKKNNNTGSAPCIREICKVISIPPACNIPVNFSWQLDQTNTRKVYFTNLTTAPTTAAIATWTFGDGTSATSWNAVHEYAQPGRYYVCLKIQFSNTCTRYKCDSVNIPVPLPPCNNQSNFNVLATSTNTQTFTFVPLFQQSNAQYTWTFGDGTGSHDMIAAHHYAQPGTYTACLTVWRNANCASTTCKTVTAQQQFNCDSAHVSFSYQAEPQVPNKIHFYANTNVPLLDQTWTITKLPVNSGAGTVTLHQNNPTYLFQDTGYYRVCLRAITLGGCVKEYCSVIHITQVANACELQAYPNPATSLVNVNVTLTGPDMIHAYMYNNVNVLVREKHQQGTSGNNIVTMEVNGLPAGPYTIKLIYGNHTCYARFQKF